MTVSASPRKGLDATLDTSVQLAALGYDVIPHIAARMVIDDTHLKDIVDRLHEAGINNIFVPSGDATEPGAYPDAVALLQALHEMGNPFHAVGITAYPESHPTIPDDVTIQAMWDKSRYATEMVSNLTFDAGVVDAWLGQVRGRGVSLPLWLGVPGQVDPAKMLAVATRIGVGDSVRFLMKQPRTVARLGQPPRLRRRQVPAQARPRASPATTQSSPGSTSSPSTRSPPPRRGGSD